jgi:uncharacterized protein VcgC/VcgE DUF2780
MDELINRLVANVGIDKATATLAVGAILGFLQSEGPADKVQSLIDRLPGADAAIAAAGNKGGGMSGLFGGGIVALGGKLMGAGLGMGEIQAVARETLTFAREKAGPETVDDITRAIPGLGQFI